jgi:signal transduction histidine kinase
VANGSGVVVYLAAWSVSAVPDQGRVEPVDSRRSAALACAVAAFLLACRTAGLWSGDQVVGPLALFGAAAVLIRNSNHELPRFLATPLLRTLAGVGLGAAGVAALASHNGLGSLSRSFGALVLVTLAGALLAGPWLLGQLRTLDQEREGRIRSEERTSIAAHLHDSVLQTLTLVQRSASDPKQVTRLARQQERELRTWLFGPTSAYSRADGTLAFAMEEMAAAIELDHDLKIELVQVGDGPLDERTEALVAAAREALVNVGHHAGCDQASLYVEVEPDRVVAYVRDIGKGFDPALVPEDRHGIRYSIVDRLRRAGGGTTITSSVGAGCDVEMWIPGGVG